MRNIYYILISTLIFVSCQRQGTYECVCYSTEDPSNYVKETIINYKSNAETYCKIMSDASQNCFITE